MERRDYVVLEDALFVGQEDWINNLYKATRPRDDLLMLPREILVNNLYKATRPRDDLLMLPREILEYVQGLRFFMGVPEERAIALFQEKLTLLEDA